MAITINGSGTITGVSAGGLPDGSVDADTLASTLDLSGKTMTYGLTDSDLSGVTTGKVLQVVNNNDTNRTTITSPSNNNYTSTVVVASITPQSSTSRMVVFVSFGFQSYNTSGDFGYGVRMARTINGTTTHPTSLNWQVGTNVHSLIYEGGSSGEDNSHKSFHLSGYDSTHSTTSAIEYNLQSASYNVSNSYDVGAPYGHRWNVTIMEIEP